MTIRLFGGDYFVGLSVAQGCRATLRGNAFGTFRRPRVPGRTLGRHFRTFLSLGGAGQNYIRMTGLFGDDTHSSSPKSTAADPSVSRTRRLAHETTSEDPSVSRTRRLAHETSSEDPPVSRMRLFAHETISEGPPVSRTRLFTHETAAKDTRGNRGAFSASYGNSTGTLRALLDAAEVRPEPVRLIERLGAFRDGDLDGLTCKVPCLSYPKIL